MDRELTADLLLKYAEKYGIKGRRVLSILGKNQQFINAINSPIGVEFIRWLTVRMENNRIIFDKMDIDSSSAKFIETRARYNESEEILYGLLGVFENHEKLLNQVKEDLVKKQ